MVTDVNKEIIKKTEYEQTLTAYVSELQERSNKDKIKEFAEFRGFGLQTVEDAGIFYIGDMTEMLLPSYLDRIGTLGVISETNYKPIFRDRWVIPIKNENGLIQNLVGYSPSADERYIYGTSKYYRRRETMYGLENLNLAYDMGYALVTEGITDTIRLRDMGYPNTFAMCGTHKSDFIMKQLNRCRHGVILIPDRDSAGLRALKGWVCNRSVTVIINIQYKDIDEMCRASDDNKQWVMEYLADCINWIKQDTHNGHRCLCEKITVL